MTVQVLPAAKLPPLAEIVVAPTSGGHAPPSVPQLVYEGAVELLTVIPVVAVKRSSVNEKLDNPVSGGAVKVNCRRELPPILIEVGLKDFVAVKPVVVAYTLTGAVAALVFEGPSVVVNPPMGIVFV